MRVWDVHNSEWVAFQLLHPLVVAQHPTRVGNTTVPSISDIGLHHWHSYREDFWGRYQERQTLRALESDIRSVHATAVAHFGSPAEFAVCYAYDVFRRGWVYQGRAAAAAASYVPHEYRDAALEFHQDWSIVDAIRGLTFSWGKYFVRLVQSDARERNIHQVARRIDDVRRVCQELLITPWVHAMLPHLEASPA